MFKAMLFYFLLLIFTLYDLPFPLVSAQGYTQEEYAVYNRCQFRSPDQVCPQPPQTFADYLSQNIPGFSFFLNAYFWLAPKNSAQLEDQAQIKQRALVPEQITNTTNDTKVGIENTVGGKNGIYGNTLPNGLIPVLNQASNQGSKTECIYNNSWFPNNVNVFTDNQDCPAKGKEVSTGQ